MKKLKLNLDEIKVESFETTDHTKAKQGTIHGLDVNPYESVYATCGCLTQYQSECMSCPAVGWFTCDFIACQQGTVFVTCNNTCQPVQECAA